MKKAACVLLIRPDGSFLGASRRHDPEDFNLVGGKVDPGETVRQAAIREFEEETGLLLSGEVPLLPVFTRPCLGETDYETTTFLGFVPQNAYSEEIEGPEEGINIRWITWDILLSDKSSFKDYNRLLYDNISHLLKEE